MELLRDHVALGIGDFRHGEPAGAFLENDLAGPDRSARSAPVIQPCRLILRDMRFALLLLVAIMSWDSRDKNSTNGN